jgi:hypothetical protein
MTTLEEAVALAEAENGLAIVSTVRADATVQASLVNVGLLAHPASGGPVLGFVTYGKVKLANLRARPQLAMGDRRGPRRAGRPGRQSGLARRRRPTAPADSPGVLGGRGHPRRLGRVRPSDGRAAADRGVGRTDPRVQQRLICCR